MYRGKTVGQKFTLGLNFSKIGHENSPNVVIWLEE
jgi:hypothetical protein